MSKLLNKVLGLLPFDGYKTFLGYALQQAAIVAPPQYQAAIQIVGQILMGLGLVHKGIKENI
jgi:hypothetical protein